MWKCRRALAIRSSLGHVLATASQSGSVIARPRRSTCWQAIGIDFAASTSYRSVTEIDKQRLIDDTEALKAFNDNIVREFRANDGMVDGPFPDDIVLLTTTGAKSGQPRLSPLVYFTIEGRMLIAGSFGGAPKDPSWVHNLRAKPEAHVEVGTSS
jgi:hypothetical protein